MFQPSQQVPKQRGIYSEILTTEDTQNLNVSLFSETPVQAVSTFGPSKNNIIQVNKKQAMPRATGKNPISNNCVCRAQAPRHPEAGGSGRC